MSSSTSNTPAITPCRTMRGHTKQVQGAVHLPSGGHVITSSEDGSLRLWDLESGAQIGEEWRDENNEVWSMALSPNGKTIATGSGGDDSVRLWDVGTRKVISKWTGHTDVVCALRWSADSKRIASGSWDGTARVWDIQSGQTDSSKLATGGDPEDAVKIWDAKTGELLNTLKLGRYDWVHSLAWTSDGKKLISGCIGLIWIFDTATWQQIAILEGHTRVVSAISLSQNNRFLASVSDDKTACLWNLETNLQVGPPLEHDDLLRSAGLSPDGKVLVTGCKNNNAYAWDVHAILKKAGLEDLLLPIPDVPTGKSLMNNKATRRPPIQARRIPQNFFDGVQNGAQSSAARGTHPRSLAPHPYSAREPLLDRWSSFFRHSHPDTDGAMELQQRSRWSIFSHRGPRIVEVPTVQDRKALFVARPAQKTQQSAQPRRQGSSMTPPAPGSNTATPGARPARSQLVRLLAHLVLFLCCASPQHSGGNAHPTQQQSQGQAQTHATSSQIQHQQGQSQTQPVSPSTSVTPTTLNVHTTASGTVSGQPRPLPLRTRIVLFICCTFLPHADGH